MEKKEKRRAKRFSPCPIKVPVIYQWGKIFKKVVGRGEVENLSPLGILLKTSGKTTLEVFTDVDIRLHMPHTNDKIKAKARVVRVEGNIFEGYSIAMEIYQIKESDRRKLTETHFSQISSETEQEETGVYQINLSPEVWNESRKK